LEAMACGTPVVASNTSSIPEVTGKAALLVSPHDEQGWIEAIRRILTDKKLAGRLRKEGLLQAKKFSWRKAAEETLRVYEKVIRGESS